MKPKSIIKTSSFIQKNKILSMEPSSFRKTNLIINHSHALLSSRNLISTFWSPRKKNKTSPSPEMWNIRKSFPQIFESQKLQGLLVILKHPFWVLKNLKEMMDVEEKVVGSDGLTSVFCTKHFKLR